jgi:hypothetical protein
MEDVDLGILCMTTAGICLSISTTHRLVDIRAGAWLVTVLVGMTTVFLVTWRACLPSARQHTFFAPTCVAMVVQTAWSLPSRRYTSTIAQLAASNSWRAIELRTRCADTHSFIRDTRFVSHASRSSHTRYRHTFAKDRIIFLPNITARLTSLFGAQ